jgi:three-Cys-motif partner protein
MHVLMPERRAPEEFIREITVDDDGLRMREAHHWTRDKLGILQAYFRPYAVACQRAGDFYVADAMAGPGVVRIVDTGEVLLGSTLIALQTVPEFARVVAMDIDTASISALRARTAAFGARAAILRGDSNREFVPALEREVPNNRPLLVLLDPEGVELHWATVRDVAAYRRGMRKAELLILFSTEGLNRMLPVENEIAVPNEMALNIFFPPEAGWRRTWERRRADELSPAAARQFYVDGYVEGLRALGYASVTTRAVTRANGALVYHLVFATDHEAGERIMRHVFETMYPNNPQPRLF